MTLPAEVPATLVCVVGLAYASVCTSETDDAATRVVNSEHPTGISSRWAVSTDPTFADGDPNPSPCPDDPSRRHVLFSC